MMIDFHTHILPCIDDGSSNIACSLAMLKKSADDGVEVVVATPHFYAEEQEPLAFIEHRQRAFTSILGKRDSPEPRILLGAEIYYFEGISKSSFVSELCIKGSDLIMIEMPNTKWTARMLNELGELGYQQSLTVILAHVERYLDYQTKDVWDELRRQGMLMQVNAGFFIQQNTRRKALSMLERGEIDLLGSDCHNMTNRLPNMSYAMQLIEAQYGREKAEAFAYRGRELLLSHRTDALQA